MKMKRTKKRNDDSAVRAVNNGIDPLNEQEKNPGNCPESNHSNSTITVQKLPADVLAQVFMYLTHTEKLISRLVCTDWNREISTIIAKSSYFTLKTVDSHEVILDSEVPWTKLKISDCPRIPLPPKTRSSITTIALEISGRDMRESMRILSRFPQLIDLDVSILGGTLSLTEPDESENDNFDSEDDSVSASSSVLTNEEFKILRNRFKECTGKLQSLTISFPFGKFDTLLDSLMDFFAETVSLIKLKVREHRIPIELVQEGITPKSRGSYSMTPVSNIISNSSRTLKYLELDFVSKIGNKLITKVISSINTLDDLKLESFLIHSDPNKGMTGTGFQIHQDFLKSQISKGCLKSLSLPWCSDPSLCEEFIRWLPQNIKFVGNVCPEHVTDEFYSTFSKCETVTLQSRDSTMFSQPCPSIRQFCISVMKCGKNQLDTEEEEEFYKNLSNSLINIVELRVVQFWDNRFDSFSLDDHDLQLIIQNFQQLRILEVHAARRIFDHDVCGIEKNYTCKLKRTEIPYASQNIPENQMTGLPLSSLKRLEKLILLNVTVTDFGIYHGLQFGPALKHMTFEATGKITDRGIQWLGTGNPNLEYFDCSLRSNEISSERIKILRKYFPMLEGSGKFKLSFSDD